MNKIQFKTRKEVSTFLKEKNVDTTNWTEEKWQSINKSQAEIHIQILAESMWDAMNENKPQLLEAGQWHIPFGDSMDEAQIDKLMPTIQPASMNWYIDTMNAFKRKVAVARCARLSYNTHDGDIDYEKDIKLYDQLLKDGHMSPFEHCAQAMNEEEYDSFVKGKVELGLDTSSGGWGGPPNTTYHPHRNTQGWCNNFKGWIPYRYLIENKL